MTSVADAYVELHVDGDKLPGKIRDSIKDSGKKADKQSDESGNRLGSKMAGGFLKGFTSKIKTSGGGISKNIKSAFSGLNPKGLMIPALVAAVPLLTSTISALTGTLVAFTGAVVQASSAALSLVGVITSLIQAKVVAKIAFKDFTKAVGGDKKALDALSPAARKAAEAAKGLSGRWGELRKAVQQRVFDGLDKIITRIGRRTVPVLQQGFQRTGYHLNQLFKDVGRFATSKDGLDRFGQALAGNNRIFKRLRQAAVPVLSGVLNLLIALQPSAVRLADKILSVANSFNAWSSAPGTADKVRAFMDRAWVSAGRLWGILKNLGGTLRNVFSAATPAGTTLLGTIEKITGKWRDMSGTVAGQNSIKEWVDKSISATKGLFNVLGGIGSMLGPLFDPKIADGFFGLFEKAMPTIHAVVGALQGALKPVLDSLGKAFTENGPKFAKLFLSVAPLLKGIGSVAGEVISQVINVLGTLATIITPVVGALSNFLGPILTKFAPVIATIILSFTTWGVTVVKMIPLIGKFLAPLVQFVGFILRQAGPALKFIGKTFGLVFRGIAKVVAPVMRGIGKVVGFVMQAIGGYVKVHLIIVRAVFTTVLRAVGAIVRTVFGAIRGTITAVLKVVSTVVRTVFNGIRTVVFGVVKGIATTVRTYFAVVRFVITSVLRAVQAVVRTVWTGIKTVISGIVNGIVVTIRTAFNLMRAVVATGMAAIRAIVTRVWGAIRGATGAVWNGIKRVVGTVVNGIGKQVVLGFDTVVGYVKSLPGKILDVAGQFLDAGKKLGGNIVSGIGEGLKNIINGIGDFGSLVKQKINSALGLPKKINGPGPIPDFTIPGFARGTIAAPGGLAKVGERGMEYVDLPRGSKVHTANASRNMDRQARRDQQRGPSKMILSVGGREFVAFLEEIADGRIDAADSLSWQGA